MLNNTDTTTIPNLSSARLAEPPSESSTLPNNLIRDSIGG